MKTHSRHKKTLFVRRRKKKTNNREKRTHDASCYYYYVIELLHDDDDQRTLPYVSTEREKKCRRSYVEEWRPKDREYPRIHTLSLSLSAKLVLLLHLRVPSFFSQRKSHVTTTTITANHDRLSERERQCYQRKWVSTLPPH